MTDRPEITWPDYLRRQSAIAKGNGQELAASIMLGAADRIEQLETQVDLFTAHVRIDPEE